MSLLGKFCYASCVSPDTQSLVERAQAVQNWLADIKDITYLEVNEVDMNYLSNMIIFREVSRAWLRLSCSLCKAWHIS